MKTLHVSLALLLLAACWCDAMPKALYFNTAPRVCCVNFSTQALPGRLVSGISRTHSSCEEEAFVIRTVKGRRICYSGTFQWAVGVFNRSRHTEGSGAP